MDETTLRTFRSMAGEVRAGYAAVKEASGEVRIVRGYLESKDCVAAYRALCLPVRRAYRESDRMSFRRVCSAVRESGSAEIASLASEVAARYDQVVAYLDSYTILNERQLGHREVFDAWLEAATFGDFAGKDRSYRRLLNECGKAVEGIAVRITDAIADRILELDDVIADLLGEPRA